MFQYVLLYPTHINLLGFNSLTKVCDLYKLEVRCHYVF